MTASNVVSFDRYVFPVHSKAWHARYGFSVIVEKIGDKRKIRSLKQGGLEMEWVYNIVEVSELTRLVLPEALR